MERIARGLALIAALTAVAANARLPDGVKVEKDVRVDEPGFMRVFETQRFFPGQKVSITVSGTIDAHHQYWEDRVCSWFGIKCWYESRESATIVDASAYPALVSVANLNGREHDMPEQSVQPAYSDVPVKHLPVTTGAVPQVYVVSLEAPDSALKLEEFGRELQFFARIADRGTGGAPLYRNRCEGRPSHCGGGSFRVSVVDVDNSSRMEKLTAILAGKVSPGAILPRLRQDALLVNEAGRRPAIARLLFTQATTHWSGTGSENTPQKLEYLEYAVELDRSLANADISNALAGAYLATGSVVEAKMENEKTFKAIQDEYRAAELGGGLTPKLVADYYDALRIAAQIGTVERSGLYSPDLLKAVGVYVMASGVAAKGRDLAKAPEDKKKFARWAYEAYVDASRVLMMMRSPENMAQAESILEKAAALAREYQKMGGET